MRCSTEDIRVEAIASMDGSAPSPHPPGLALALEDLISAGGRRLRVSARVLRAGRLDALGVRLHIAGANRLLVDGYHSWDWAGLRDFRRPGAGWWGGIVGGDTSPAAVHLRLDQPPDLGALHLSWDGLGRLDLLTTGVPEQEWERSGQPTSLGRVAVGSVVTGDAIGLAPFDDDDPSGAAVPTPPAHRPGPRAAGWMSWNCLGPTVTGADARAAVALVPPHGVVLVDDGWAERWGDWTASRRFGSSLPELATALGRSGVRLGCWLAPFLADPSSRVVAEHPEWLLRDPEGGRVVDDRPEVSQLVLDASLPEVRHHLAGTGERLARSGVSVLKLDFLYAGASAGRRAQGWTGVRALRAGMEHLVAGFREAAGPQSAVWLCGAPAPPLTGLGDACRSGGDAVLAITGPNAVAASGPSFVHGRVILRAQERNLAARAWLWGSTLPPDVDAVTLGRVGETEPVDDETAQRWLHLAERAGGPLLGADVQRPPHVQLPGRRRELLRASQERVAGLPARPVRVTPALAGTPAAPEDDHFLSQPET